MEGKGIHLTCHACKKQWTMDEYGQLEAVEGDTEYPHIPNWYQWQREVVRRAIADGSYCKEKIDGWMQRLATVFNRGFWDGYYLGRRLGEWSERYGSQATENKVYLGLVKNYFFLGRK